MSLNKEDFERLADFRYRLRRFLRFSEDLAQDNGITHCSTCCCCN